MTQRRSHDLTRLEAVRQACLRAASEAYEDAGVRGLCGDGRWELALDAVRTLDLQAIAGGSMTDGPSRRLRVKRVYEPPAPGDGLRILVDRLWPRGLPREKAALDAWMPEVAPSTALRRWFGHAPSRWAEFQRRFAAELSARSDAVHVLADQVRGRQATLLFGARDLDHNNAVVLRAHLRRHFHV